MINNKVKKIVLCATQRSGSTMVCDDLERHGMGRPKERFIPLLQRLGAGHKLLQRLGAGHERVKEHDLNSIVNQCVNPDTEIMAIKVMASYGHVVNQVLDSHFKLKEPSSDWASLHRFFQGATFVHVVRANAVQQAISRIISSKTGIYHLIATKGSSFVPGSYTENITDDDHQGIKISNKEVNNQIINIAMENQIWLSFFKVHKIQPVTIVYEQCAPNIEYLTKISKIVGYDLPEATRPRNLQKLPSGLSKSVQLQVINDHSPNIRFSSS